MAKKTVYKFGIQQYVTQITPNGVERQVPRMVYGAPYDTALEALQANVEYMARHPRQLCWVWDFEVEVNDPNESVKPN